MATFSAVVRGAAGTAALPFAGIYAPAGNGLVVREIKCFTAAANAATIYIQRASTAGTWGTGEVEIEWNEAGPAPTATVVPASSAAPTMGSPLDVAMVGAAIGSGWMYTYYGEGRGLYIAAGTANGLVLIEQTDTANSYYVAFVWDE
jgi:hypothetical protein